MPDPTELQPFVRTLDDIMDEIEKVYSNQADDHSAKTTLMPYEEARVIQEIMEELFKDFNTTSRAYTTHALFTGQQDANERKTKVQELFPKLVNHL